MARSFSLLDLLIMREGSSFHFLFDLLKLVVKDLLDFISCFLAFLFRIYVLKLSISGLEYSDGIPCSLIMRNYNFVVLFPLHCFF